MPSENRRSVVIRPKMYANLKELAKIEERSVSGLIREAVSILFKRYNFTTRK